MQEFLTTIAIIAAVAATWLVGGRLKDIMFTSDEELWDCVCAAFRSDLVALLNGEFWKKMGQTLKIQMFIALSLGAGMMVYFLLGELFGLPV